MAKLNFQQLLLQSQCHSSQMLIYAQETFLIINVENSCAGKYFCGNVFLWYIFSGFFETRSFEFFEWIECSKEQHLFEIEIFCNFINVFTVPSSNECILAEIIDKHFTIALYISNYHLVYVGI